MKASKKRKNAASKKVRRTSTKFRSPRAAVMAKKNAKRARSSLKPRPIIQPALPSIDRSQEMLGQPISNIYPDINDARESARTEGKAHKRVDIGDKTMDQGK